MRLLLDALLGGFVDCLERAAVLPRPVKRAAAFVADLGMLVASTCLSYSLRLGVWTLSDEAIWKLMLGAVILMVPIFVSSGVYRAIFRYAGVGLMRLLLRPFLIYGAMMVAIYLLWGVPGVPRTLGVLQPILFFMMVAASRITVRSLLVDVLGRSRFAGQVQNLLIYGAGSQGQQTAASLRNEPALSVVGYIDDDKRLDGQQLDGLGVYHSAKLPAVVKRHGVTDIVLALPYAGRKRRSDIVHHLEDLEVRVKTLPPMRELVEGKVSINDIRPLDIEDLLGREPVRPQALLLGRTISGKTVLVTGAGGSIGSELCRQIVKLGVRRLILIDVSEFALYAIESELTRLAGDAEHPLPEIVPVMGSVLDEIVLDHAFGYGPVDTVYHAAAYKHVPLVEANPLVTVRNNIVGTHRVLEYAHRANVSDFLLISTDKAVRPTNVMGATKRSAEQIVQSFAKAHPRMCCAMVRFGNVLGSSGSVVPLFRRQIEQGGPVTVTHRDVTRYFMTIPEAASLVIQAAGLAKGGEVFVLDMGEQIRIVELAKAMIRLSGLTIRDTEHPSGDVEIVEIGLRPGEKLYEELLIGTDPQTTAHPRIMMAREDHLEWDDAQRLLGLLDRCGNNGEVIALLRGFVREFDHRRDDAAHSHLAGGAATI